MLAFAFCALLGGAAAADPACDDTVSLPNPVYMTVGDTQINLMKALGQKLRQQEGITLIWRATGSCTNLDTLYSGAKMSGNFSYIPKNYDPVATPTPPTCSVPLPGVQADIANSIVFLDGCPSAKPATVTDFLGPVQSFVFVAPLGSAQNAITAAEAYFVFGFGMAGQVAPWLDNNRLLIRPVTKGTLISMAASIGVPAGKWKGVAVNLSQDLASMLASFPQPDQALGILGSEVYDGYRGVLKALAFRANQQNFAYYPDSTQNSFDKQNVRDGHYHMWSYTHWLLTTGPDGKPVSARAQRVIDILVGNPTQPPSAVEAIDSVVAVGLIPECAMSVARTQEGGDLSRFAPPAPCSCYFDQLTTKASRCKTCTDATTCGGGVCRHNFCEAR